MTYTATLYFFGDYRPLVLEDTSRAKLKIRATTAAQNAELYKWISEAISCAISASITGCSSTTVEHGAIGLRLATGKHDPWLDKITSALPDHPQINYNA